jgi:hypothetical protein
MHYPKLKESQAFMRTNRILRSGFGSFNESVKETRDAVGLSVFSDSYEYYAPEKAVIAITG